MGPNSPFSDPNPTNPRSSDESAHVLPVPPPAPVDPQALRDRFRFLSPPAPAHPDDIGRLGPYRITKLLGEGGMGIVFRGEDEKLLRPVALKVMQPSLAADETARTRFLREARAVAAIRSDHVVTVYQVDEANAVTFLAMEFLEGQSLDAWLRHRAVSPIDLIRVAKDVFKGLVAAHEKGLIHRDLKPGNLWVETPSRRVKLLDFGLTRGGSDPVVTTPGHFLGTPAYMAPEQADGHPADARSDLFSVGVVLYRMIAGYNPFQKGAIVPTLRALVELVPAPAATFGLPEDLAALIDQLLSKNPDARPQTAAAALQAVHRIERRLRTEPSPLPAPSAQAPPTVEGGALPGPVVTIVAKPVVVEEAAEEFEFVLGGERRKGTRRVRILDLGGGQKMTFVRIEKGRFWMGAPEDEDGAENERPLRPVEIAGDFFLGIHAVTQAQYQAVTGEYRGRFRGDRLPVDSVSWEDAIAFCERVSERTKQHVTLPTEEEWEYACRAGTTTPFHFGPVWNAELANCEGAQRTSREVGSYPANPWGLHEMHGNVWEWCADSYGPYDGAKGPNATCGSGRTGEDCRVLRGGSWACEAAMCRAAARIRNARSSRGYSYGFRVCFRPDE